MAKPKRSTHSGVHKNHGPKRHLFKDFKPMVHTFGSLGMLTKYNNEESFIQSYEARTGKKLNNAHAEYAKFVSLKTRAEQDAYLKALNK